MQKAGARGTAALRISASGAAWFGADSVGVRQYRDHGMSKIGGDGAEPGVAGSVLRVEGNGRRRMGGHVVQTMRRLSGFGAGTKERK
jgi:hypothetical protein